MTNRGQLCEGCGVWTFNDDHICAPPPTFTAEHPCPICGADTAYEADYGAPGVGQSWVCRNGHPLSRIGGRWVGEPRIQTPEETR